MVCTLMKGIPMNRITIAPYQLFCMLFLGRALSSMLYSPIISESINPTGQIIGIAIGFCIQAALLIPMFVLLKKYSGEELCHILLRNTGKTGYIIVLLYMIYCIVAAVAVLCEISYFMANFTRDYDMVFYLLIASVMTFYVAKSGLQTVVRIGFILFVCLAFAIVVSGFAGIGHIDFYNIKPLTNNCFDEIFNAAFIYSSANMEIMLLPVLAPFIKTKGKGTKKAAIMAVGTTALFAGYTLIFSSSVLGTYMEKVVYPYFMTLASIDFFDMHRLDVLQVYLWFSIAVIEASLFFFSAVYLGKSAIPLKKQKPTYWIVAAIVLITSLTVGRSLKIFSIFSLGVRNIWVLAFFITLVPIILFLCETMKRRWDNAKKV